MRTMLARLFAKPHRELRESKVHDRDRVGVRSIRVNAVNRGQDRAIDYVEQLCSCALKCQDQLEVDRA